VPRPLHRIDDDLHITASADPALIHDARLWFGQWLTRTGGDPEMCEDLLVVLSELLANAAEAAPDVESTLSVRARWEDDGVVLEVTNPVAPWVDAAIRWDLDDPLRTGGRGLLIVSALVDEISAVQDLDRNAMTLRCRRSLSPN
jgi:anti-sigma regulatory factor (Ser/Thr protein kinase)